MRKLAPGLFQITSMLGKTTYEPTQILYNTAKFPILPIMFELNHVNQTQALIECTI